MEVKNQTKATFRGLPRCIGSKSPTVFSKHKFQIKNETLSQQD
jgi:hypothetical protein